MESVFKPNINVVELCEAKSNWRAKANKTRENKSSMKIALQKLAIKEAKKQDQGKGCICKWDSQYWQCENYL